MDFKPIGAELRANLDEKNKAREIALPLCRKTIRLSADAIRAVHRDEKQESESLMDAARLCLDEAAAALSGHPDVRHAGFYHDAAKEFAEARITHAIVFGLPIPSPSEIRVEAPAYLNGLGEAVGEMRRHILDLMRRDELAKSEQLLEAIDDVYYLLISMDYPDAITGGLRRTTDIARSIIERTRGDLTTTLIQAKLMHALEERSE